MLRNGDKDLAGSDIDGRVMALEQNIRGLNARICAFERSFSADPAYRQTRAMKHQAGCDDQSMGSPEIDDFVPASALTIGYDPLYGQGASDKNAELPGTLEQNHSHKKASWFKLLPLDFTGLIAGAIMVLISILLYTGNLEMLKNPLMPFLFGVLLIACVCVRIYNN